MLKFIRLKKSKFTYLKIVTYFNEKQKIEK